MRADLIAIATVFGMSAVTLATRMGGAWMMGFIPMTARLRLFLRHLASSVMVAAVVGGAARGDVAAWLAIAVSTGVMISTRRAFPAIVAGMVTAAGWRAVVGA